MATASMTVTRLLLHAQTTFVEQTYPAFRSPYQGTNNLPGVAQGREIGDVTLFGGMRLWQGAELDKRKHSAVVDACPGWPHFAARS